MKLLVLFKDLKISWKSYKTCFVVHWNVCFFQRICLDRLLKVYTLVTGILSSETSIVLTEVNQDFFLFQASAPIPTGAPNQARTSSARASNHRLPCFRVVSSTNRPPQKRSSSWHGARWSNFVGSWKRGRPRGGWGERPERPRSIPPPGRSSPRRPDRRRPIFLRQVPTLPGWLLVPAQVRSRRRGRPRRRPPPTRRQVISLIQSSNRWPRETEHQRNPVFHPEQKKKKFRSNRWRIKWRKQTQSIDVKKML